MPAGIAKAVVELLITCLGFVIGVTDLFKRRFSLVLIEELLMVGGKRRSLLVSLLSVFIAVLVSKLAALCKRLSRSSPLLILLMLS